MVRALTYHAKGPGFKASFLSSPFFSSFILLLSIEVFMLDKMLQHYPSIRVGRCSDLGGDIFLSNKSVISLRNNAYMQYGLQYCNEVH